MNIKSFSKIAAVSAIAMVSALSATDALSYVIGTDQPIAFNATVDNTIDVAVVPGEFGTIAAHRGALDIATAVLPAAAGPQTVVDDHSTGLGTASDAHIVGDNTSAASAASVTITNAFQNEDMFITFSDCVDLAQGGEAFDLVAITTSNGGSYDCAAAYSTPIAVVSNGTGDVPVFYVGASIATQTTTPGPYTDGAYLGSVQMQVIY